MGPAQTKRKSRKDRVLAYLLQRPCQPAAFQNYHWWPWGFGQWALSKSTKEVEKDGFNRGRKGYLLINGQETITAYSETKSAIRFLLRDGQVLPFHNKLPYQEALFVDKFKLHCRWLWSKSLAFTTFATNHDQTKLWIKQYWPHSQREEAAFWHRTDSIWKFYKAKQS